MTQKDFGGIADLWPWYDFFPRELTWSGGHTGYRVHKANQGVGLLDVEPLVIVNLKASIGMDRRTP